MTGEAVLICLAVLAIALASWSVLDVRRRLAALEAEVLATEDHVGGLAHRVACAEQEPFPISPERAEAALEGDLRRSPFVQDRRR